jgi:hypothetical protein
LIVDDEKQLLGVLSDRDIKKYISPFATAKDSSERDRATLKVKVGKKE